MKKNLDLDFYLWTKVLTYLYKRDGQGYNIMKMCRDEDIATTATVYHILSMLERKGLIRRERKGRKNIITLTKDGRIIGQKLIEIGLVIK